VNRKITLALTCVVACAFLLVIGIRDGLVKAGLWATLIGAMAAIVAAAAAVWVLIPRRPKLPSPPAQQLPDWWVGRTEELTAVVDALIGGEGRVGISTGLYGAGGFGKTTLALMACADPRIRRRFEGGVYVVTMGRDVRGPAALAAKVNDVLKLVGLADAAFTDPQLAGQSLAALLAAGPSRLLMLDDVWDPEQLAPFRQGGEKCAVLVTTRVPGLLTGLGPAVRVDQMTLDQARLLLTAGLPPLAPALVDGLVTVTGRWPLLLRLVSRIIADYAEVSADVASQAAVLLERLREAGPAVVDEFLGAGVGLDVARPDQRARAVRTTIGASTSLLGRDDADRFSELGVFAADELIPFALIAGLWHATSRLDGLQAAQVCRRLTQLGLVSPAGHAEGGIELHDVVRDFLRVELGDERLAELNRTLLDEAAGHLAEVSPLDGESGTATMVAWWDLGDGDRYLRDHLIEHLRAAGRPEEAEALACDLRWAGTRLAVSGPASLAADLSLAGTVRAHRLQAIVERLAHLLKPAGPAETAADLLYCRVADDPDWGPQVATLRRQTGRPALISRWPLPDLPGDAVRRVLNGRYSKVRAVAIAPDGSWLAAGGDGTVLTWDTATWAEPTVLTERARAVTALVITPDSAALAIGTHDGTVAIRDKRAGRPGAPIRLPDRTDRLANAIVRPKTPGGRRDEYGRSHSTAVLSAAIAPDGSWLAAGGHDGTVRISKTALFLTGVPVRARQRVIHSSRWSTPTVLSATVAVIALTALSGLGLTSALVYFSIRHLPTARPASPASSVTGEHALWHVLTWPTRELYDIARGIYTGIGAEGCFWIAFFLLLVTLALIPMSFAVITRRAVNALAVAPDGSWLATGGADGTVRIWDPVGGRLRGTLAGHVGAVNAVAVAPDGSWLATGGDDTTVRIWDPSTAPQPDSTTRARGVRALAVAPDNSWLATGDQDGKVRIWDAATGFLRTTLAGHGGAVYAIAVAADGGWLATGGNDRKARIWDPVTGQEIASVSQRDNTVYALAVAPDDSWLATGGNNGTIVIWERATGHELVISIAADDTGQTYRDVRQIVIAPDASWLAVANENGSAQIRDAGSGKERKGLSGAENGMALAPDGSWLATCDDHGTVRIWDPATDRDRATLTARDGTSAASKPAARDARPVLHVARPVNAAAIARDGSWLATGGTDGTITIWDPTTLKPSATLQGTGYQVTMMALAPDGNWLATGTNDGVVQIWETKRWQLSAAMRVEAGISGCAWLGNAAIAVAGVVGLFVFDFSAEPHPGGNVGGLP